MVTTAVAAVLVGCGMSSEQIPAVDSPASTHVNEDRPLLGTAWELDDSKATLKITGGQLVATNGCQSLNGGIRIHSDMITIISPVMSAGPYCPTVDELGLDVFPVLTSETIRWQVSGDHLKLTDGQGRALNYSMG